MLVVAFDGILFDTLPFRAAAVVDALAAEGIDSTVERALSVLPALSVTEAVRALADATAVDETTLDLASLRAERVIREFGSRGATLNIAVRDRLRRAATVTRIVVRADSRRREVDELLAIAELDAVVSLVRCSDDGETPAIGSDSAASQLSPFASGHQHALPKLRSIERSYAHIARRMYSNSTLLGASPNIGIALEVGEAGQAVARTHGFATPESFDAANLQGG